MKRHYVNCVTNTGNVSPGPVCRSCADRVYTTRSHIEEEVKSIFYFILHCQYIILSTKNTDMAVPEKGTADTIAVI